MKIEKRLLRLVKGSQAVFILTITLGLTSGLLLIWQARLLSSIVAEVFLRGSGLGVIYPSIKMLAILIVLRGIVIWGMDTSALELAIQVKTDLRKRLADHIMNLGPHYANQERAGELTNVTMQGVEATDAFFRQYLPQVLLAALLPLSILVVIFSIDRFTAFVLLLTAPLIPIFITLTSSLTRTATKRQWEKLGQFSAYFLDVLQGITTLKVFGRSLEQVNRIARVSDSYRQATMSVLKVTFLSALTLEMVATISTAVVAVEIGLRLLYGRMFFVDALFVLLLAPEFYLPLRNLGARFHAGMSGVAAAERIYSILDNPLLAGIPPVALTTEEYLLSDFSIKFRQISFSYEEDQPAVDDVDIETRSNTTCALVGASGSGKSTLIKLLFGFIQADHGEIWVGSKRLSDLPLSKWWEYISWVPQQPFIFNDSIDANIRIARPDANQEEIVAAARHAYAHDFIQQLPEGYQTVVGERGARLSAGQIQRIILARSFLKDAPLIILDEPTAHLDQESEEFIYKAYERLFKERTVWVIAHRLPTVVDADQILVVKDGGIIASGDHTTLIRTSSYYQQLVSSYHTVDIRRVVPALDSTQHHNGGEQQVEQLWPELANASYPASETAHWRDFLRLIKLLSPHKWKVALSVVLGYLTIFCGIGLMSASAYIISAAALHPSIAALQVTIVGVRFFGISRGVFRYLDRLVSHDVTMRILALLRTYFYQRLEPLAPARISQYRSGDLLNRVIADIAFLENIYVRGFAPPLVAISIIATMAIFMFVFHPSLSVMIVLFLFAGGFGVPVIATLINRNYGAVLLQLQSQLSSVIVDGVQGLADILILGQKDKYLSRLFELNNGLGEIQRKIGRVDALQNASVTLLANMAMWCVLIVTIPLVWNNEIAGVYLAVIILAVITSFEAVIPLPQAAQNLERDLSAARRLYEITDQKPEIHDPMVPLPAPVSGTWQAKKLTFSYPSYSITSGSSDGIHKPLESDFSLQGLDFSLFPGMRLAVVGPSGAGKSTIANLLLRFWEFKHGELLYDDQQLREYSQVDIRAKQSLAMQNGYIFNTSLRENLLISYPDASTQDLDRAISCVQLDNFLHNLPTGYDAVLGEAGAKMSSGERQRLMIARAVLRKTPLMVLDEATAHLDPIIERKVLGEIIYNLSGRALMLITHRLVFMEEMDEILVVEQGRISERGSHTTLLNAGGYYRRMWDYQGELLTGTL